MAVCALKRATGYDPRKVAPARDPARKFAAPDMTAGQRAMVVAKIYPEADDKGGRGKKDPPSRDEDQSYPAIAPKSLRIGPLSKMKPTPRFLKTPNLEPTLRCRSRHRWRHGFWQRSRPRPFVQYPHVLVEREPDPRPVLDRAFENAPCLVEAAMSSTRSPSRLRFSTL
jgi:hypothetical protein